MNLVDIVVLAILLVSGLLGVARGFVREVLGLGAWIGAAAAAFYGFPTFQPYFRKNIESQDLADILTFAVVFVVVLVVLSVIAGVLGRLVRGSALGALDRTLGLVFGLARGAALLIAAYIVAGMGLPPERWPPVVQQARTLPIVYDGAAWVVAQLPQELRPRLEPPPGSATPRSEALLQVNPAPNGRLFNPPRR